MAEAGDQRWLIFVATLIGILSGVGTFLALSIDPWMKVTVAAALVIGGLMLGWNGVSGMLAKGRTPDTTTPGGTTTAPVETPSRPKTIEDGEDPAVLTAAGYHRTDYPHRWEMDGPDADALFEEQSVALYDEDGNWLTTANVFVVLKDCAWASGSAKYFKNRNNTPCGLETLLALPEFRNRLSSASHLVFVGMESYLNAPKPASSDDCNHVLLTACRADRLLTRTYIEYFTDDTQVRPDLWELDIGYANTKSPALEWYQRRALILGIRNRRPGLSVQDAVTRLATGTKVGDVVLSDYSKVATAVAEKIPYDVWGPGKPDTHR